jgi:RNA polymerase sigma factor (sigma-70 family)
MNILHAKEKTSRQLAKLVQQGVPRAFEDLIKLYDLSVRSMANYLWANGNDRDDVVQSLLIGLWKAAITYDESRGAFVSFSNRCMKSEAINLAIYSNANKFSVLNNSCSTWFRRHILMSWQDETSYVSWVDEEFQVPAKNTSTLQGEIGRMEAENFLLELTTAEKEVLLARISMPQYLSVYPEIKERTGLRTKQIDNAMRRATRKARIFQLKVENFETFAEQLAMIAKTYVFSRVQNEQQINLTNFQRDV